MKHCANRKSVMIPDDILQKKILAVLQGDDVLRMRSTGRQVKTIIDDDPRLRNRAKAYIAIKEKMNKEQILALFEEQYAQADERLYFFSEFLALDGICLAHAPSEIQDNREIVLIAVKENGRALEYASQNFRQDRDVVLSAVRQNGLALRDASDNFANDRDIVLSAVKQYGPAFEYASLSLKNDKDVVSSAVKQYGLLLQYASDHLKNEKDVVLSAVKQNGFALQYASETLRNDKDVVLSAVKHDSYALEYASLNLRMDRDFALRPHITHQLDNGASSFAVGCDKDERWEMFWMKDCLSKISCLFMIAFLLAFNSKK